jgi:tRNA(fMet)-specific endonuclease VapC
LRRSLDTNICLRVLRDRPHGLRAAFIAHVEALCLSDVVLYELLYGAAQSLTPYKRWIISRQG